MVSLFPSASPVLARVKGLLQTAALCLLLAILPVGCTTPPASMPVPGKDWKTNTGQLQYRSHSGKSVIGDVVVRRSGSQDFLVVFTSGPGLPLLKLQISGDTVNAEGVFARGRWSGKAASAPQHLKGWVALRECFTGIDSGNKTFRRFGWVGEVQSTGSRITHEELSYEPTGERFVFHFSS